MEVSFVGSYPDLRTRPQPELPEFAFLGRSNCGKSSLINYVLDRKNLARTSRQPGKTRLLNYYLVGGVFYLVDLPGYGYAKFSKEERQRWWRLFEDYLTVADRPLAVLHLVDARHAPSDQDREVSQWLVQNGRPFAVVATKIDKVGSTRRLAHYRRIIEELELWGEVPFLPTSAHGQSGREELLAWVQATLGGSDDGV